MGRKARSRSVEEREGILERVFGLMCSGVSVEEGSREVGIPAGTLRYWIMEASPEVRARYFVARRLWGAALAEEALVVARESVNQTATVDKLKVDTLLRLAGKANPAEYGEKQVVEHTGSQVMEIRVVEEVKPVRQIQASAVMDAVVEPVPMLPAGIDEAE
jgi:hypothetical protein